MYPPFSSYTLIRVYLSIRMTMHAHMDVLGVVQYGDCSVGMKGGI